MELQLIASSDNRLSIHKYDNVGKKHPHRPDNVFLDVYELNVPQHEAIPSLFSAYKALWIHFKSGYLSAFNDYDARVRDFRSAIVKTPADLGLTQDDSQYKKLKHDTHLQSVIRRRIRCCWESDLKKGKFGLEKMDAQALKRFLNKVFINVWNQLERQRFVCGYTGVPLSIGPAFNQISIEKIDRERAHFDLDGSISNCVIICRLLNTSGGLSPIKLWDYCLHQAEMPSRTVRLAGEEIQIDPVLLTNDERRRLEAELEQFKARKAITICDT
jgi:hypothetical protein